MNQRLTLTDIASLLAEREEISLQAAEDFVRTFFELTEEGLSRDSFVKVSGFGTTKLVEVSERESVDVNTGERIQISSHSKVSFTPDNKLRELVNRPFEHFSTINLHEETTEEELESASQEGAVELPNISAVPTESEEDPETSILEHPPLLESEGEVSFSSGTLQEEVPLIETATPFSHPIHEESDQVASPPIAAEELDGDDPREEPIIPNGAQDPQSTEEEERDSSLVTHTQTAHLLLQSSPSDHHSNITNIQGSIIVKTEETPLTQKLNFWKTAFFVTLALLLCVLCYFVGYHRGVSKSVVNPLTTPTNQVATTVPTDTLTSQAAATVEASYASEVDAPNATMAPPPVAPPPTAAEQTRPENPKTTSSEPTASSGAIAAKEETSKYKAEANKYQQLPRGTALIVGTLRSHTLGAGDNIYRLARQTYGSNDFAPYIILYNGILDPDVIPLNQEIKLPKLVDKNTLQLIEK